MKLIETEDRVIGGHLAYSTIKILGFIVVRIYPHIGMYLNLKLPRYYKGAKRVGIHTTQVLHIAK